MFGLPCEHACIVILSIGQNVVDFVDEWYAFSKQELIYSRIFCGIEMPSDFVDKWYTFSKQELIYFRIFCAMETLAMPIIGDDGMVGSLTRYVVFSLNHPHTKSPLGRPRKKQIVPISR